MKTLIADDDPISRRLLQGALEKWGYEVTAVAEGKAAWDALQAPEAPQLLVLDWLMPGMDGIEICRKARLNERLRSAYIVLVTSRGETSDIIEGLESGADDYVTKPFDAGELRARIQVGRRVVELQMALAERVHCLEEALAHVKQLHGLLPICAYCKKVRDDQNYWHQVETYVSRHADVRFSHGVCPDCLERIKKDLAVA